MTGSFDYVAVNAAAWDERRSDQLKTARRGWSASEPTWGIFGVPEDTVHLLPDDLNGKAVPSIMIKARRWNRKSRPDISNDRCASAYLLQAR